LSVAYGLNDIRVGGVPIVPGGQVGWESDGGDGMIEETVAALSGTAFGNGVTFGEKEKKKLKRR